MINVTAECDGRKSDRPGAPILEVKEKQKFIPEGEKRQTGNTTSRATGGMVSLSQKAVERIVSFEGFTREGFTRLDCRL